MDLVGSVVDSDVVIVDDMIDTAGTLGKAADVLVANGGACVLWWCAMCVEEGWIDLLSDLIRPTTNQQSNP